MEGVPSEQLSAWAYVYGSLPVSSYYCHDPAAHYDGGNHDNSPAYHNNNNSSYHNNGSCCYHYNYYYSGFLRQ